MLQSMLLSSTLNFRARLQLWILFGMILALPLSMCKTLTLVESRFPDSNVNDSKLIQMQIEIKPYHLDAYRTFHSHSTKPENDASPLRMRRFLSSIYNETSSNSSDAVTNSSSPPTPPLPSSSSSSTISITKAVVISLTVVLTLFAFISFFVYFCHKKSTAGPNLNSESQLHPIESSQVKSSHDQSDKSLFYRSNQKNSEVHPAGGEKGVGRKENELNNFFHGGFTTLHNKFLDTLHQNSSYSIQKFSFKEVKKATNNFSKRIGTGSYGPVFKACFNQSKKMECAVKIQAKNSIKSDKEFLNEVLLLGKLHHRYLVNLFGYCSENNNRILIYEYMHNGSLEENLHSAEKNPLSWNQRMRIAIQIAIGIRFLHEEVDPPIIHRDIKPANILLDKKMNAKIADFGISSSEFHVLLHSDSIKGTIGYVDPEYLRTKIFTKSSDVYSFGILLFEILSGKSPHNGLHAIILSLVKEKDKLTATCQLLADPRLSDHYPIAELADIADVAFSCIQKYPDSRPSIKETVNRLCAIHDLHASLSASASPLHHVSESRGPTYPAQHHLKSQASFGDDVVESRESFRKDNNMADCVKDNSSLVRKDFVLTDKDDDVESGLERRYLETSKPGSRININDEGLNLSLYQKKRNIMLESIASS